MTKKICLIVTIVFYLCSPVYALDWKKLHETADTKTINTALEKNDSSLSNLYILGLVYLNNHKDKEAENVFRRMLGLNPKTIEAQWGLAEVLRRRRKINQSQKILNNIIKSNPEFAPAYISLAYIKYTQTDFREAIKLALAVRKKGPDEVDLSNYSRAYLIYAGSKGMIASKGGPLSKLFNGTQVLPNLKKAEKLQPDSPAVLFGLGSFYFLAPAIAGGNLGKALKYLERAIEVDPFFADSYVRLAQIYKVRQDNEKYQAYMDKALEIDPDNELALDEIRGVCKFNCVTVEE